MDTLLPPLFEMDNYTSCMENKNNLYCNVQATLNIPKTNTNLIDIIKTTVNNKQKFDRNYIHRGLCIAKEEIQNFTKVTTISNETLKKFGSVDISEVEVISCMKTDAPATTYDIILLVLAIGYVSLVLYATFYERIFGKEKTTKSAQFLKKLSLHYNWQQRNTKGNDDFRRLLSMQSLRFFLMMGVIYDHVLFLYSLTFMSNPDHFENIIKYVFNPLCVFIVIPFFMISSWLLILQTHSLFKKQGEISFKNVGIIILNRYFRLIVTVVIAVSLFLTSWISNLQGLLTFTPLNFNSEACSKNWMKLLLCVGNFNKPLDVCHVVTWYISADFQVYVINLVALYVKYKLKIKNVKFYTILLLGSCLLHGSFLYFNGNDIIYSTNVRNYEENTMRTTQTWMVYYSSTYSVWASSVIGLIFGEIYLNTKTTIKNNKVITMLWAACFFGIPTLALLISTIETNRVAAAILGSIVRPLFNLGFGIGVLGMSLNIGGYVKKLFETKIFVMLGNFSYCTYIIHMLPLILLHGLKDWPWHASLYEFVRDLIFVSIISWPMGILYTLLLEDPALTMQKKILPQIKRKQIEENKNYKGLQADKQNNGAIRTELTDKSKLE